MPQNILGTARVGWHFRKEMTEGFFFMDRKHNPKLTENAKELRKNMTKEEKHLWYDFLKGYPVRFLRQKIIDLHCRFLLPQSKACN